MRLLVERAVVDDGTEASVHRLVGGVCVITLPWRSWRKLCCHITLDGLGRPVWKAG